MAFGAVNLNNSPEGVSIASVAGLKDSLPLNAKAVTTVGEARKFIVEALPSFLPLKFLKFK